MRQYPSLNVVYVTIEDFKDPAKVICYPGLVQLTDLKQEVKKEAIMAHVVVFRKRILKSKY